GTGKPIEASNDDDIEPTFAGIRHHAVKLRPTVLRAGDTLIAVLGNDFEATTGRIFLQGDPLRVKVLPVVFCRDAHIKSSSFHNTPSLNGISITLYGLSLNSDATGMNTRCLSTSVTVQ